MSSETGRKLHGQAEDAREHDHDFLKSLSLLDLAIQAYQEDGDLRGVSEALQSKSSAYKHLYQKTGERIYLIIALHESLAGVEISEGLEDKSGLAMAYRGLAKIYEQLNDWGKSANFFQKAVDAFIVDPPEENNRPAVLFDMKAHLGYALYVSDNKDEGKSMIEDAIKGLESDTIEVKYNRDVWLSGAHMRAANMLKDDEPEQATNHFHEAEKIIASNNKLVLRAKQLDDMRSSFES